MRLSLSIKTMFRSPLRTLITFVLLAAAAFMLVYSASDYALTQREYKRAVATYRGFVSVEKGAAKDSALPWRPYFLLSDSSNHANYDYYYKYETYHQDTLAQSVIDTIINMPYITSASLRYMTAGLTDNYYRNYEIGEDMYKNYYNTPARFVIEATFNNLYRDSTYTALYRGVDPWSLIVSNVKFLAGDPEWMLLPEKSRFDGKFIIQAETPTDNFYEVAKGISINAGMNRPVAFYRNNHILLKQLEKLVPGQRYIFVLRIEPDTYKSTISDAVISFYFGDDTIYDWWPYIYPVEGLPDNYLEFDDFAPLRELIKVTNDDIYTLDVVYTDDMESIRRVAESRILLVEGRFINQQDSIDKNKVCVVSKTLMDENNLVLGDTIKLKLGDKLFEQYAPLGAVASTRDRYADNFTEAEFTIIGSYIDINIDKLRDIDLYWAYNDNTVFIPQSFLPNSADTENHEFKPSEITFIVGDARNIRAFSEKCIPQLAAMGYTVYFNDGGWLKLEEQFRQAGSLALIKLLAFSAASALAGALTVYLFIGRKRREYAVMRALGTTKRNSARTLFSPLMLLALVAVTLGGLASVAYVGQTASDTMKTFADMGLEVNPSIPIFVVIIGMLALLIFEAFLASISLYRTGKKPPLMLLQENTNRNDKAKKVKKVTHEQEETAQVIVQAETVKIHELEPLKTGHYGVMCQITRYVLRHSRRALVKSLLVLFLAALISGAMGQFTAVRQSYSELYHNIIIKARFINGLSYEKALKVADSGYVNSPYYEFVLAGESNFADVQFVSTDLYFSSDLKRITKDPVEFLSGYDETTIMSLNEKVCLLPVNLMDELEIKLGDTVELNSQNYLGILYTYHPEYTPIEMEEAYHRHSVYCKVVGRILTESIGSTACIPVTANPQFNNLVYPFMLDLAEYNLSDYHKADEFRKYAGNVVDNVRYKPPLFLMDTTEADNIYKIYKLIKTLYPIAAVIAILIGAVLPGLIIIQSAKEASILRVLGTTKRRTRVMLIFEQLILCLIGLILSFAILAVVNSADILKVIEPLGTYCLLHLIGCTVGTTIAAITVTRRKILELLQVKE